MRLDQTAITIRERTFGEILGLALQVTRTHFVWLCGLAIVGTLPFALLNGLLLGELVSDVEYEHHAGEYWWGMAFLMALETPFATAPITLFLGQVTFNDRIRPRQLVGDLWRSLPQMILLQGILRALLLPLLLLPYFRGPYLNELILLERNRLFGGKDQISTLRRSRNLHTSSTGELFGQWLLSIAAGGAIWGALATGAFAGLGSLAGVHPDMVQVHRYILPATLWTIVAFFAVVRFLCYLDLRIRREGWEIELLMKAEAQRMRQAASFG